MKILSYPLSVLHYLLFGVFISIFHPIQWFCLNVFGYSAHKKSVDVLNYFLLWTLYVLGTRIDFKFKEALPEGVPLIFVSNHQCSSEISPLSWYLRKHHPKFVSKIELGKGIPSVSFNLKYGGSVLIDRKDPRQSLSAMATFAKNLEKNNWGGLIFPEGTRSKTGVPKRFSSNGLKILTKFAPSAYVVPITINNSWKLVEKGAFPLKLGVRLKFEVHEAIAVKSMEFDELFKKVEENVKNSVTL